MPQPGGLATACKGSELQVLSHPTRQLLRHAGESFRSAQKAIARELQVQLDASSQSLCRLDEHLDNTPSRDRVQELAVLAAKLQAVNEHVWEFFSEASALVESSTQPRQESSVVVDQRARVAPGALGAAAASWPTRTSVRTSGTSVQKGLSPNDLRVFDHLMQVLDHSAWTRLTYADISKGAGVPVGSIGIAIRRLVRADLVCESNRGNYRLSSK